MDVAASLRNLELERYISAFRDNDIDAEVLPKLTAEDLISIGVTSVGHRRKLLEAIAGLATAVPSAVLAAPTPSAPAQVDAERRQLTVMFCDVVGSTALSTRYDPEDLRELIGGYHSAVAETVRRFDGFVAKYMGDGVLIYFGYPQAHEDGAERAVGAALAVIEAVGRLPTREDLGVRLGIATRLAVVGDLIGEGAAQERGVVGETPASAADRDRKRYPASRDRHASPTTRRSGAAGTGCRHPKSAERVWLCAGTGWYKQRCHCAEDQPNREAGSSQYLHG